MTTSRIGKKRRRDSAIAASLTLILDRIYSFLPILQQGFMVKTRVGSSLKTMLCEQCGVGSAYLEERIKTIFLDGRPVDDIDSAIIKDGSTLALSAAMPGLVGATMRRGGILASFRATTTHREEGRRPTPGEGMVTVKFFNLLIKEMGPAFLEQGVWVRREALEDFLRTRKSDFWEACKTARVDGKEIDLEGPPEVTWPKDEDLVLFRVQQAAKEKP